MANGHWKEKTDILVLPRSELYLLFGRRKKLNSRDKKALFTCIVAQDWSERRIQWLEMLLVCCRIQEGLAYYRLFKTCQYNRLKQNITALYQYNRLTFSYNRLMLLHNRPTEIGDRLIPL